MTKIGTGRINLNKYSKLPKSEEAKTSKASGAIKLRGEELTNKVYDFLTLTNFSSVEEAVEGLLNLVSDKKIDKEINHIKKEVEELNNFVHLNGGDWIKASRVKNSEGQDIAANFQAIRVELNERILKLANKIGKKMDIQEISMAVLGTPGHRSDIDIGLRPTNLPTDHAVLMKFILEGLIKKITGSLPSKVSDTEWYIPLKFYGNNIQSKESKAKLSTLSLTQGYLQAVQGLIHDKNRLNKFIKKEIKYSPKPQRKLRENLLNHSVRVFEEENRNIRIQMVFSQRIAKEKPKDQNKLFNKIKKMSDQELEASLKGTQSYEWKKYEATWLNNLKEMLKKGKECGSAERKVASIQKQLQSPHLSRIQRNIIRKDSDRASLIQVKTYHEINRKQPECTFSPDEINTTLLSVLGQGTERTRESRIKVFGKINKSVRRGKVLKPEELVDHKGREVGLSAKEKFILADIQHQMLHGEISPSDGINMIRGHLTPEVRGKEVTIPMLILAAQERCGQFAHVMLEGHHTPKAAISAGKYNLRVMEANLVALYQYTQVLEEKGNQIPKNLYDLIKKAERKYFQAYQLERSKREFTLNTIATKELLMEQIDTDDPEKLSEDLTEILSGFDPPNGKYFGDLIKKGEIKKKSEIVSIITHLLEEKGYIESTKRKEKIVTGQMIPKNPQILAILEARAGYRKDKPHHKELVSLHDRASEITLNAIGLKTKEDVQTYEESVLDLSREIHKTLFELDSEYKLEIMPKFDLSYEKDFPDSEMAA